MLESLDELESGVTAEELNRMERRLPRVVSVAQLRKVVKRAGGVPAYRERTHAKSAGRLTSPREVWVSCVSEPSLSNGILASPALTSFCELAATARCAGHAE